MFRTSDLIYNAAVHLIILIFGGAFSLAASWIVQAFGAAGSGIDTAKMLWSVLSGYSLVVAFVSGTLVIPRLYRQGTKALRGVEHSGLQTPFLRMRYWIWLQFGALAVLMLCVISYPALVS